MNLTTSWDDGHPLDLRLAELLDRAELPATFYIPRTSQREVIRPSEIRALSERFEIGAHTLTHLNLRATPLPEGRREILESKDWVEQITGKECRMFCFPGGKFRSEHVQYAAEAGYRGCRTVELLSVDPPSGNPTKLMPTSVQASPHGYITYLKNCVRRQQLSRLADVNLFRPLLTRNWHSLARELAQKAHRDSGVFHLWGHAWEIEEQGQWANLRDTLHMLRDWGEAVRKTNGQLCLS